jgi:hypothetical protein
MKLFRETNFIEAPTFFDLEIMFDNNQKNFYH